MFIKYGLILLLIYFPVRPLLVELFPVTRFLGDIVIIALFSLTLIQSRDNLVTNYRFTLFFLLFIFVGAFSALFTGVLPIAVLMQIRAFVVPLLLLYVVGEWLFEKKDILHLLWTSFFMGCLLSTHGLVEKLSHRSLLVPEAWQEWQLAPVNSERIYGLVANPNVLAVYLMIVFFLTLYLKKISSTHAAMLHVGLVLLAGTILLTYSRGTLIAFGIALLFLSFTKKKWNYLLKTVIYFSVALVVIYFPVDFSMQSSNTSTSERFIDMFSEKRLEQSANGGRLFVVSKGLEIFMDYPMAGMGFGTFGSSATVSFKSPIIKRYDIPATMYADNQYMQILVETGIIGALFMFLFIFYITKRMYHSPLIFILIVGLIGSVFYSILEDKTFTLYFYIAVGFALNQRRHFYE